MRALAFFEVFEFAPTKMEIWRWQCGNEAFDFKEIQKGLEELKEEGRVAKRGPLFALAGKEKGKLHRRRIRAVHGIRKNIKVRAYIARVAQMVPGVKGIAICNTRLPFLYAKNESDIDLLVITKKNTIWITRFLLVGILKLSKKRPGEVTQDAFDHSMFISEADLNMEKIADSNPLYVAAWVKSMEPIYGKEVWEKFEQENKWANTFFPAQKQASRVNKWFIQENAASKITRALLAPIILLEPVARFVQKKLFTNIVKQQVNRGTSVIASETMLKFHTSDKREEYQQKFEILCRECGV